MNKNALSPAEIATRAWISFLVVTGGVLVLVFLYQIRSVVLQIVVALIFALALAPIVKFMEKHKLSRAVASVAAIVATSLIILGLIGAIASPLVTQGGDLVRNLPHIIDQTASNPVVKDLNEQYNLVERGKQLANDAPKFLSSASSPLLGTLGSIFTAFSTMFVVLIMALFMLIEGPTAWQQFIRLLPRSQGRFTSEVAKKIIAAVSGFVNGNLFISLIAGVITLITLLIAGVPYAFALAALVAIFDLIPLVGASIATVVVGLVALTQGIVTALIVVGILLVYQFVEGNIIQPVVYGRAVQLSQLLIVVASIVGATLGGIVGVLLAIPVAAALQIIVVELLRASGVGMQPEVDSSVTSSE